MEMEIYAVQEVKEAQTRARAKFIEEGERNTRYFFKPLKGAVKRENYG